LLRYGFGVSLHTKRRFGSGIEVCSIDRLRLCLIVLLDCRNKACSGCSTTIAHNVGTSHAVVTVDGKADHVAHCRSGLAARTVHFVTVVVDQACLRRVVAVGELTHGGGCWSLEVASKGAVEDVEEQ